MKRLLMLAAVTALTATTTYADVVAPDDVALSEYGDITMSLTGIAGDPVRGADVMTDRGLGNCIACHQVTALSQHQFHGEIGTSLDGSGTRWEEAALRGIVVNAKNVFPDTIMPSFYRVSGFIRPGDGYTGEAPTGPLSPILSAQDVEDVVAYLMTLQD